MRPPPAPGGAPLDPRVMRPLMRLALPFLVQHLLSLASLVINRLWVGQVGTEALAGLGSANAALMIVVTFAMGMAVGALAGVARNVGAQRPDEAARYVAHGLYVAVGFGLLMLGAAFVLPGPVLAWMGADPAVSGPAADYLAIGLGQMVLQAPLVVAVFAFQGAGEARAALVVGAAPTVVNAALDPLFIFGFDLGMPGAAWAMVVSHVVGVGIAAHVLARGGSALRLTRAAFRFDAPIAGRIVAVGVPGSLEHVVRTSAGFAVVTLLQPFGPPVVSAYTACQVIMMVMLAPALSLSQATAALVGQSLGAGVPQRAWRVTWVSAGLYTAFIGVAGTGLFFVAAPLVAAFDSHVEAIREGELCLRYLIVCGPLIGVAMVVSRAFGGAGRTLPAMSAAIVAHLVVQIPAVWWLSREYGTAGAYAGVALAFAVHALLATALFVRHAGRWRTGAV